MKPIQIKIIASLLGITILAIIMYGMMAFTCCGNPMAEECKNSRVGVSIIWSFIAPVLVFVIMSIEDDTASDMTHGLCETTGICSDDENPVYKKIKYRLNSGYVTSTKDGRKHFISEIQLAGLYNLDPNECIGSLTDNEGSEPVINLYPREDGNYDL